MNKAYLLLLFIFLASFESHALLVKTKVIDGTIVTIDRENIIVRDSKKQDWKISRSLLKDKYKLLTGEPFHSVFNESDVSLDKK